MNIDVLSLTSKALEERDWQDVLEIRFNNRTVFTVHDGEPEDANLRRDFNDCLKIPDLLLKVYDAGKRGEEMIIKHKKVDEI